MNIGICGFYDISGKKIGGQHDRTKIIVEELKKYKIDGEIHVLNLVMYRSNIAKMVFLSLKFFFQNNKIIYIVSRRGNLFFTIFFGILNLFQRKQLYCVVIGGPKKEFFLKHKIFFYFYKKIDGSFYEIEDLAIKMKEAGCRNTYFFPNAKKINNKENIQSKSFKEPYKVCTYSRVTKEKGIFDAIDAVINVNKKLKKEVYKLDIYGSVEKDFEKEFFEKLKGIEQVTYVGKIDRKLSKSILENYYLMLFPTHHKGEGVPGGVIDSLEAGLPVIATNISYNATLISDGKTGKIYEETDIEGLEKILYDAYKNPKEYLEMRLNCIEEAQKYDIDKCMKQFTDIVNKNR